jgi:hypothetical protein
MSEEIKAQDHVEGMIAGVIAGASFVGVAWIISDMNKEWKKQEEEKKNKEKGEESQ